MYHHLNQNRHSTRFWIKNEIPQASASDVDAYGKTVTWWPSDSEEAYKAKGNLYKPTDFGYTLNKKGYRSIEFDKTSKNPKIMFVGCSFTTGIGVPFESVYTSIVTDLMSKHFGVEFEQHNLGLPGYGADAMAQVVYQATSVIKPDIVLALFPGMQRRQYYPNIIHRVAFIPNYVRRNFFSAEQEAIVTLQRDSNDFYHWVMNWQFIEMTLRELDIPWVWGDYAHDHELDPFLHHYVRTDNMIISNFPPFMTDKDFGRDMMHPGPKSHASYAQMMFEVAKIALEKKWSSTA